MTIKQRRERQKTATREGILDAALSIARSDGWAAVTIRRVAEMVEYTPPIIYEYFANKDALLQVLQAKGFAMLADAIQQVKQSEPDPAKRLLLTVDVFIDFAYAQPELYQLMHGWNTPDEAATLAEATRVAELVLSSVDEWATGRNVALEDSAESLDIVWAAVHGLISVEMLGRLAGGQDRVRQLARQTVEDLLYAWTARSASS